MAFRFIKLFFLIITVFFIISCAIIGKHNVPKKSFPGVIIPDGEFLRYGVYTSGEKVSDYYYVVKKVTKEKGGLSYRFYINLKAVSNGNRGPGNYTEWPISILFNPVTGQTIESEGHIKTNDLKEMENMGYGGLTYWHYQLFRDKGYIKYVSKSVKGDQTFTKTFTIKVKTDFPIIDLLSSGIIAGRFIDPGTPGVYYLALPNFLKEPLPVTSSYENDKESMTTKAGTFRVHKLNAVMADPFIAGLTGEMMKSLSIFIEDSDRRLMIKSRELKTEIILEEISNVKTD